ncbi:cysteine-rich receptor-like protein kinase 6 isoform X2 [Triticum dicoccoides]|uniref:cysteine-rich receptor-like protein kinase 6 isoform X2 n=1 Tax=Triticum dicoccoides TaxID=85692 RepID=UPI00188F8DD7|nr:cysteine-rich receptor-like protein kinase 6 isoform X2 [Triticum dicoccoides]
MGMARLAVLLVAIAAVLLARRAAAEYPWPVCGSTGSFAANDTTYLASISAMAATLPRNASASPGGLYATARAGQVRALALCRGDANATACSDCLYQGFQDLPSACAYTKEATMYYDPCFLHYSDADLRASDDTALGSAFSTAYSANATAEPARFDRVVAALLNATADYAAYNSSRMRLYASGVVPFDREIPEVYSWAQCTPDLTPARCRDCLANMIQELGTPLYSVGARALGIRCSVRYENRPFLDGPVMLRLPATGAPAPSPAPALDMVPNVVTPLAAVGGGRKYSVPGMVLIVVLPTLAAANLLAGLFIWRRRRRSPARAKQPCKDTESVDSMLMDISTLRAATGDFAESNKLGEGGFGAVYKGTLPDGEEIAVKRLSKSSTQGVEELKNELALVVKLKHKNLVRLVGVCLEQQERLLVYEFIPNRSLDQILFDTEKGEQLDWGKRQRIIRGIARGLQYLHEDSQLKVVHRDLKASNVLLDADMNPKISDFGLARLFGRGQTQGVTDRVIGTYGYMAPEYLMRGNYSVKSDVFSFGVMALEIVTGRKNSDTLQSEDLLTMIWQHWTSGTVLEMMDPCMNNSFSESDARRCIQVGLMCVQENPVDRPVMSAVGMMLGSDMVSLGAPSKPASTFYTRNAGADSGNGFSISTISLNDDPKDHF